MSWLIIIYWFLFFLVFYTYLGYGIVLFFMVKVKRLFAGKPILDEYISNEKLPDITLLVAAYNEKDFVAKKMENSLSLEYPSDKLHVIWVTDGSDDGTPDLLVNYPMVKVLHKSERNGKIAAMNRAMQFVNTPIVVFSDANTLLGNKSLLTIAQLMSNSSVGCVAGEKRIFNNDSEAAAAAGEGLYWKYESKLKQWDAELYSVVGAAGELFAIRTELFKPVEGDTILDDFVISLRIAMNGLKTAYNPNAYAIETSSANVKEEMKRKIRIAAGGIQAILRLLPLLNIFKYGILSFQYISHRVLRWTLTPLALLLLFIVNAGLLNQGLIYSLLFIGQILFYVLAAIGYALETKEIKVKIFFIPYYFTIMNLSVYYGFVRFLKKKQSVNWERAKRA